LDAFRVGEIHDMGTIAHRDVEELNIRRELGLVKGLMEERFT